VYFFAFLVSVYLPIIGKGERADDNVINKRIICICMPINSYIFHYICHYLISNCRAYCRFCVSGLPSKFVNFFVHEVFFYYSKFVKAAKFCKFFSITINNRLPICSKLYYLASGFQSWHLNLPSNVCSHFY
jgi:hypothetical protein